MMIERLNYTLKTNNAQRAKKQKGFGNSNQTQLETQKQNSETSGSIGMVDRNISTPLRPIYYNGKMSKVSKTPYAMITFGGNNRDQQIVITAEMKPYASVGGVSTVVDDYKAMFNEGDANQKVMIMPYYNGHRELLVQKDENGKEIQTAKWNGEVKVNQFPQGTKDAKGNDISNKFYYTNAEIASTSMEKMIKNNQYKILEEVAKDEIEMGDKKYDIGLYRVEGTNHYMVYSLPTARMRKAYETKIGGYSSQQHDIPDVFEADDYAVFCKAAVKLLPNIKEYYKNGDKSKPVGFDPYAILCNDGQTAYVPHYVAMENSNDNPYYKTMNMNYVVHNAGRGYIGETSLKKMAVNLGLTKEEMEKIKNSQDYIDARKLDEEQHTEEHEKKFWREQIFGDENAKNVSDDEGIANALSVAISYTNNGTISQMYTVAEAYADSFKNETNAIPHLQQSFAKLGDKFIGNLNGLDNLGNLDPTKRVPFQEGYAYNVYKYLASNKDEYYTAKEVAQRLTDEAKAKAKSEGKDEKSVKEITPEEVEATTPKDYQLTAHKFEVFDSSVKNMKTDADYDAFKTVQARNRLNLFKRFIDFGDPDKYPDNGRDRLVTGIINRAPDMIGKLDLAKMTGMSEDTFKDKSFDDLVKDDNIIQKMKDLHVTVSWGRGDLQKGIDNVIAGWMKEAERDDKAVLVVGAGFVDNPEETEYVKKQIDEANKKFEGRVVYLNSFAPASPLSIIADIALLPSRFAPCELTDLEAMKYGACPVVSNIQGLKQKNFDPEIDIDLFARNEKDFGGQIQQTSYRTVHNYNLATHEQLTEYDVFMNKAIEFLENKCKDFKIDGKNIIQGSKEKGFKYNTEFKNDELKKVLQSRDLILNEYDKTYSKINGSDDNSKKQERERHEIREILRGSMEFVDSGYTTEEKKLRESKENAFKNTYGVKTLNSLQQQAIDKEVIEGRKKLLRAAIDKIMANEIALASVRQICASNETKRKISSYNMNINTTMKGNHLLHKVALGNGSTEEIYKEGLKNKENTIKNLYSNDINASCKRLKEAENNAVDKKLSAKIKTWWQGLGKAGKWGIGIGTGVAAAAAIGGGIYAGVAAHNKKLAAQTTQTADTIEISQHNDEDLDIDIEE